jgi:hypothetical protein
VQKVESGGVRDDHRGVLDHEDVEDLRLPRLQLVPLLGMCPRPDEGHIGIPVGVPGAGQALEQEVAEVEVECPGVDRLGRVRVRCYGGTSPAGPARPALLSAGSGPSHRRAFAVLGPAAVIDLSFSMAAAFGVVRFQTCLRVLAVPLSISPSP